MAPFCSCPASLVSGKFFAVGPGCAKCFFLLRSVGRRDLSAGPEPKKKHHPGRLFFFAPAPGKGRGRRSPVPARGQSKKKHHPGCVFFCCGPGVFFFCSGPVPAPNGASPSPAFPRGRSKKKNTLGGLVFCSGLGGVFFCSGPAERSRRPTERNKKKTHFAHPGPTAKNFLETNDAGRADAHSLTAGLGGDASPSPGWCFFFLLRPCPDRWCFFCCGPARTLTHSLWAGAISARPGWCFFFCCGPAGSF